MAITSWSARSRRLETLSQELSTNGWLIHRRQGLWYAERKRTLQLLIELHLDTLPRYLMSNRQVSASMRPSVASRNQVACIASGRARRGSALGISVPQSVPVSALIRCVFGGRQKFLRAAHEAMDVLHSRQATLCSMAPCGLGTPLASDSYQGLSSTTCCAAKAMCQPVVDSSVEQSFAARDSCLTFELKPN